MITYETQSQQSGNREARPLRSPQVRLPVMINNRQFEILRTSDNPYSEVEMRAMGAMETEEAERGVEEGKECLKKFREKIKISKLILFLRSLIKKNNSKRAWRRKVLEEDALSLYARKVKTLLEEIRQIDLQFLAVNHYYHAENNPGSGNALDAAVRERMFRDQRGYARDIRKAIDDNTAAVRKNEDPGTAKARRQAEMNYRVNVEEQIHILDRILNQDHLEGFRFNVNTLQMDLSGNVRMFMTIVAPNIYGQFKDLYLSQNREVRINNGFSGSLFFGIEDLLRVFSWCTLYSVAPGAGANNLPMVRVLELPYTQLRTLFDGMISEDQSSKGSRKPFNVDIKIPNQFGIPANWEGISDLLKSAKLRTIGAFDLMPQTMGVYGGELIPMEQLKADIGFCKIVDGSTIMIPDVHFLSHSHTAFFEIDDTDRKPRFYNAEGLERTYETYMVMMQELILFINGYEEDSNIPLYLLEWVTELLEANHCMPPGEIFDLHGNLAAAMAYEQSFASRHINAMQHEDMELLINTVKARVKNKKEKIGAEKLITSILSDHGILFELEEVGMVETLKEMRIWTINMLEAIKNSGNIIRQLDDLIKECRTNKANEPEKPEKLKKLIDAMRAAQEIKQILKEIKDIYYDYCFERILDMLKMPIEGLLQDNNIKYHFIAFCFKLLRCIKENVSGCQSDADIDTLEETMFSQRENGDYYDSVNMRDRVCQIGSDEVFILPDKMMSTNRFRPKGGETKRSFIPFVGGASGTTRDISRDLMHNGLLEDEEEYWKFQLANASFMILNNYHSFIEVIFRAAVTRMEYKYSHWYKNCIKDDDTIDIKKFDSFDRISSSIALYLDELFVRKSKEYQTGKFAGWSEDDPALHETILTDIIGFIDDPSYQPQTIEMPQEEQVHNS